MPINACYNLRTLLSYSLADFSKYAGVHLPSTRCATRQDEHASFSSYQRAHIELG